MTIKYSIVSYISEAKHTKRRHVSNGNELTLFLQGTFQIPTVALWNICKRK